MLYCIDIIFFHEYAEDRSQENVVSSQECGAKIESDKDDIDLHIIRLGKFSINSCDVLYRA
jgi:hypothetical protein